jgi:hypothetical protein
MLFRTFALGKNRFLVIHITQVDGESLKANYFGVGVGIGVGIEKVLFDPDSDSDPDPDPIHLSQVDNHKSFLPHLQLVGYDKA